MCLSDEKESSILEMKVRSVRKDLMIVIITGEILASESLYKRPSCHTRSKAFSTSRKIEAVFKLLLKF